jgi:hypothetical protein
VVIFSQQPEAVFTSSAEWSGGSQQNVDHAVLELRSQPETCVVDMDAGRKFQWKWLLDTLMGGSGKIALINRILRTINCFG